MSPITALTVWSISLDFLLQLAKIVNTKIELRGVEQEYNEKINKAEAERLQSLGTIEVGKSEVAKLENQVSNYRIRNGMYIILAPQDGQITQAKKAGLGEVIKEGEDLMSIVPPKVNFLVITPFSCARAIQTVPTGFSSVPPSGPAMPEVAKAYVAELRDILRGLKVSDVKMEQGSLRCDANVSLKPIGSEVLGTRSETKNVNSLRSVERAIRGEMIRHAELLNDGKKVKQETRHFQEDTGLTRSGRSKEQAEDYRYFPDPDLVPVTPAASWIEELRATLPERPSLRRKRIKEEWNVPDKEMAAMINADVLDIVEATVLLGADPTKARTWWLGEISRIANEKELPIAELAITPAHVAELVELVAKGDLTDKLARQVVEGVVAGEGTPSEVVAKRGIKVVNDDGALMAAIEKVCAEQAETAEKVRGGHLPAAGALIGAVMKETKGQADAARVRELLLGHLGQVN